jgi:hypothetical protein
LDNIVHNSIPGFFGIYGTFLKSFCKQLNVATASDETKYEKAYWGPTAGGGCRDNV